MKRYEFIFHEREYDKIKPESNYICRSLNKIRIDIYLSEMTGLSRSFIQKQVENGFLKVNKNIVKSNYKLRDKDRIELMISDAEEWHFEAEEIPLDILYEDEHIIVLNKPKGMVVHPGSGVAKHTLAGALLFHCKGLSEIGGVTRPGIVHRLDKDTSGVIVAAKNDRAHLELSRQFHDRTVSKEYIALVHGNPKEDNGIIDMPIGRSSLDRKKMAVVKNKRSAKTLWSVIEKLKGFTLLKITPKTGRTHQIRVHLNYIGLPIAGDTLYGKRDNEFNIKGQALHAYKISFDHPVTGERVEFCAQMPEYLKEVINKLRRKE